jgi:hypothetical protein
MDAAQDVEDLLLLARTGEHGTSNGQAPDGNRANTAVTAVGNDAANLVSVVELQDTHLLGSLAGLHRVRLGQHALSSVVEEATNGGRALDQPALR